MRRKAVVISILVVAVLVLASSCGRTHQGTAANGFTENRSGEDTGQDTLAVRKENHASARQEKTSDFYDQVVMLAPALLGVSGNYVGDIGVRSLGYRYGAYVITASENTDIENAVLKSGDRSIARAVAKGDAQAALVLIGSTAREGDFDILERAEVAFPPDFPKVLRENIAVFKNTAEEDGKQPPPLEDYIRQIAIGEVFVVGQVKHTSKPGNFRFVENAATITAVSNDGYFFALQGVFSAYDMGGVVVYVDESGNRVPVGIIIKIAPRFETQALAVSLRSIAEFLYSRDVQEITE